MQAFASDTLTFMGKFFSFPDSPAEIVNAAVHPLLWQGIGTPQGIPMRSEEQDQHTVTASRPR